MTPCWPAAPAPPASAAMLSFMLTHIRESGNKKRYNCSTCLLHHLSLEVQCKRCWKIWPRNRLDPAWRHSARSFPNGNGDPPRTSRPRRRHPGTGRHEGSKGPIAWALNHKVDRSPLFRRPLSPQSGTVSKPGRGYWFGGSLVEGAPIYAMVQEVGFDIKGMYVSPLPLCVSLEVVSYPNQ